MTIDGHNIEVKIIRNEKGSKFADGCWYPFAFDPGDYLQSDTLYYLLLIDNVITTLIKI